MANDIQNNTFESSLKRIPLSVEKYTEAARGFYYVDKTLLIKNIIDDGIPVNLFTRPRRFGKSLNMSMLKTFFEKTDKDTSIYFQDKKIWQCGNKYTSEQGKYPVIYLDFKEVHASTWELAYDQLTTIIMVEYGRHPELKRFRGGNDGYRYIRKKVASKTASRAELEKSLQALASLLTSYYNESPIIIIDEYDEPIQSGYLNGYYNEVIDFMRNFLSAGLKGENRELKYAFITGVLKTAQESIFSALNSLNPSTVLDGNYSDFFGFTHEETCELLDYYGMSDKYAEVYDWYDGYMFGQTKIFNPWSVLKYVNSHGKADKYWVNTSSNGIIYDVMKHLKKDTAVSLSTLMKNETICVNISDNVVFPRLNDDPYAVYTLLVHSGYLKIVGKDKGTDAWILKIPNREIYSLYSSEIISSMEMSSTSDMIMKALLAGDASQMKEALKSFLVDTTSFMSNKKEYFYEILLTGILAVMNGLYILKEEYEAGNGRPDILLIPKTPSMYPGIIIETERCANADGLISCAQKAIAQINKMQYDTTLKRAECTRIYKVGAAFCDKEVEVIIE